MTAQFAPDICQSEPIRPVHYSQ